MTEGEFDQWWEGHPGSVRLAANRYRPLFLDAADFQSELYVSCRAHVSRYQHEHPVSHWLCLEAQDLMRRLVCRQQRAKRDWRMEGLSLDDPGLDEGETRADAIAAPESPIEDIICAADAFARVHLTELERLVMEGTILGYTADEIGAMVGKARHTITSARYDARRKLRAVLALEG